MDDVGSSRRHRRAPAVPAGAGGADARLDFGDVFGGPPRSRRSSMQLDRTSFRLGGRESMDLSGHSSIRRPWSGPDEGGGKPVFGGGGSPSLPRRKSNLGDEFFDDIYAGGDVGADVFAAASPSPSPSSESRFFSPNRLGPSTPSFSAKFGRARDDPAFGHSPSQDMFYKFEDENCSYSVPASPNSSNWGHTSKAVQDDPRRSSFSLFRHSSLSRLRSNNSAGKDASGHFSAIGNESRRHMTSLEAYVNSNQFHFSFHKWAILGVSIRMSTDQREKNFGLRGYSEVVIHGIDLVEKVNLSSDPGPLKGQAGYVNTESPQDSTTERNENANPANQEKKPLTDVECGLEKESIHIKEIIRDSDAQENNVEVSDAMDSKMRFKCLHDLLKEGDRTNEIDSIDIQSQAADDTSAGNEVSFQDIGLEQQSAPDTISQAVPSPKKQSSRAKGKVKEFIKLYNPEASVKQKGPIENKRKKPLEKERSTTQVQPNLIASVVEANEVSTSAHLEDKMETNNVEGKFEMDSSNINRSEYASNVKESVDEAPDTSESNTINVDVEDFEECLIDHLSEYQVLSLQSDQEKEQIKIADTKVREWKKGKEGNIRSLLSTLQYVLWTESGWKPVPLMDIIEGPAVKKAYNKALLCLHPDKLQQRGAARHQKYIAEKVFDILQEAWSQFNAISGL